MTTLQSNPTGILGRDHKNRENFLVTIGKYLSAWVIKPWYHALTGPKKRWVAAAAAVPSVLLGGVGAILDRTLYMENLNGIVSTSHTMKSLGEIHITDDFITDAGQLIKIEFTPNGGGPRKYAVLQGEPRVLWTLKGKQKVVMQARVVPEITEAVALVTAEKSAANNLLNNPDLLKKEAYSYLTRFKGQSFSLGNPRKVNGEFVLDVIMDVRPKVRITDPALVAGLAKNPLSVAAMTDRIFLAALGELPEQQSSLPSPNAGPQHFVGAEQVATFYGQEAGKIREASVMDTVLHNPGVSFGTLIGLGLAISVFCSGSNRQRG